MTKEELIRNLEDIQFLVDCNENRMAIGSIELVLQRVREADEIK